MIRPLANPLPGLIRGLFLLRRWDGVVLSTPLLLLLSLLAGCGDTTPSPSAQADKDRDAQQVLSELEPRIEAWHALPPEEREEQGKHFGPELEKDLEKVSGTSAQNKIMLWLADWRLHYAAGKGVQELLDRLDASPFLKMKGLGERLRVEWLLRTGDLRQARVRAEALVERIPEFQPLLNLVLLHEAIGHPAPRTAGENLSGGPGDPAKVRTEPYLVYVFLDVLDNENTYVLRRWLTEASNPAYHGSVRIVLVTSESTPLIIAAKIRDLPAQSLLDVLWSSPDAAGAADDWRTQWKLSSNQRVSVVLGPAPGRLILAVPFEPDELRVLLPAGH